MVAAAIANGSFARPEHFVLHAKRRLPLTTLYSTHPTYTSLIRSKQQLALRDAACSMH
eukprot:COSAG02_NODE_67470_length_253_cov_0.538961_1_plen_57_part_10